MSPLRDLQRDFQRYVTQRDDAMRNQVVDTAQVSAETRLAIYADGYRLRLLEALEDTYPALKQYLGESRFTAAGLAYIDAHPSTYPSIRWFGDCMAAFLRSDASPCDEPVVAELAAFEWSLRGAFDDADQAVTTLEDIAAIPPEEWPVMHITLHPSVRRLDLQWNTTSIWNALEDGATPEPPEQGEYPTPYVIWRHELQQYFRSLPVDEAWALDQAATGMAFGDLCEGLCEWVDAEHVATRAAGFLQQWTVDGLVCAVATS